MYLNESTVILAQSEIPKIADTRSHSSSAYASTRRSIAFGGNLKNGIAKC
ncbi:hypothetical protein [Argonema antarcticum]|nr:hypothetical protein [Argonema antarcticum]MCL1475509.1 hypothetical protein [Argonema antarcticum A004/B2]